MTSDKEFEDLLAELRVAGLVVDPVPERVTFAAKASLAWRTIDAELAELTYDSVLDDDRLSLVRGATAARMLTFSAGELTVDVERVPLDQAPDAWVRQQRSPRHKLVIVP